MTNLKKDSNTTSRLTRLENFVFDLRKKQYLGDAVAALKQLYGERDDFDQWVERLLDIVRTST